MNMGFSRVPLGWVVGLPLAGYLNRNLPAAGFHRELYVRAAVFTSESGAETVCLVSAEVLSVDSALTQRLRAEIQRELGIAPDAIMLAATHTHASVGGLTHFPVAGNTANVFGDYAPERVEQFLRAALLAVRQAYENQVRLTLWSGKALTHNIAANRREPAGAHDPNLPFLIAKDENGAVQGAILSYACHPTILNADNRLYSGDLIGTACALLEERWSTVLGLTGAAGDISTRFTRRESTTAEVERMARELADAVLQADVQPLEDESITYARGQVTLPVKPAPNRQELQQSLTAAQKRLTTMQGHPQRRIVEAEIEGLQVQLNMGERPAAISTEVQVFRPGGTYIISLPGELFVRYGLHLIDSLAPAPVLIAGYANDYVGYVTTPEASDGYEADSAIVPSEAGNMLVQAALKVVEQCD